MTVDDTTSHDRLESLVERQQETLADQEQVIRELRDTVDRLEAERTGISDLPVGRRTALQTGGLLGLLALGVGTASADPQGQVGTETNPLQGLYTDTLDGPLTADTAVESLVGPGLTVEDGTLRLDFHREAPDSLADVHAGMARDDDGTYVVTNDHELQAMAHDLSADYRLDGDIIAEFTVAWNGGNGFAPIGEDAYNGENPFTGTFDGNGYTITGLTIDRDSQEYVGLFGWAGLEATVTNVALENATVNGDSRAGGLVGYSRGTVTQSSTTGSVTSSGGSAGGLVGHNVGAVRQSYATGSVNGSNVGGLVGFNEIGDIRQSYATGSVNGAVAGGLVGSNSDGTVTQSYATGSVNGEFQAGGLVGDNSAGTVTQSYWDVPATGQNSSDGSATGIGSLDDTTPVDGLSGTDLNDALESDFDFGSVWATVPRGGPDDTGSDDYPVLQALDRAAQLEVRG